MTTGKTARAGCGRCTTCRCAAIAGTDEMAADPPAVGAETTGETTLRDVPATRQTT
jgi:hypothetical protein